MRKIIIILLILVISATTGLGVIFFRINKVQTAVEPAVNIESAAVVELSTTTEKTMAIAAGVVPHHLVAEKLIKDFFVKVGQNQPSTIILAGPDHFSASSISGRSFITLNEQTTDWQGLKVDKELLDRAVNFGMAASNNYVEADHSIMGLLPFIKEYVSSSSIVPILVSSKAKLSELEELAAMFNEKSGQNTVVIASVDFSHYLPKAAADFHDVKSKAVLLDFKKEDFGNIEVDSWQSLYLMRDFARLRHKEIAQVVGSGNSLSLDEATSSDSGTSYFSVLFGEQEDSETIEKGFTILALGDIMLDRQVENLMKKNNWSYPFDKIDNFLKGIDVVWGNLEGPIVKEPKDYPLNSYIFNFAPQTALALKQAHFNLVALANNHTLNRGVFGLVETRELLRAQAIMTLGDPGQCGVEYSATKKQVVFLAINRVYPNDCSDDKIIQVIKLAREAEPKSFLAVSFHWGNEYKKRNSQEQQKLGHSAIEAGADVVIGHHPHVVQNVEIYQGKPIFYSLGNFIFDQYFSLSTQESLGVGIEIYDSKVLYRLFPIKGASQPALMDSAAAAVFLARLAAASNPQLAELIKGGMIEVNR